MRFDLTDMQLFLHIIDTGSITAGASRMPMSLASASARIKHMEETLGLPLLLRGRRGVHPTPVGRALAQHARRVLRQMDNMYGELAEYTQGMKGRVRLLCNTAAISEFLPEALSAFMTRHPNVDIDLEERLSHEIVRAVAAGQAEVGIVADTVELAGLETFPFRPDRLVLVATPAEAAAREAGQEGVPFASLLECDFIGLAGDSALGQYLARHAERAGKPFRVRVRLRSFDAICRMVESGVGISVIPEAAARRCAQTMAIRCLPLSDPWSLRHLTLCMRSYAELPLPTRKLIDELRP